MWFKAVFARAEKLAQHFRVFRSKVAQKCLPPQLLEKLQEADREARAEKNLLTDQVGETRILFLLQEKYHHILGNLYNYVDLLSSALILFLK
jgi:hypothetical protein